MGVALFSGVGKPALFSRPEGGGHLYPVSESILNAVKGRQIQENITGPAGSQRLPERFMSLIRMILSRAVDILPVSAADPRRSNWERCMLRRLGFLFPPRSTGTRWKMRRWSFSIICRCTFLLPADKRMQQSMPALHSVLRLWYSVLQVVLYPLLGLIMRGICYGSFLQEVVQIID